jgi:hypothetical protein
MAWGGDQIASRSYRQTVLSENVDLSTMADGRVAQMRQMLADMQPGSTASALRALRDAFPEASLEERVRALTATRH